MNCWFSQVCWRSSTEVVVSRWNNYCLTCHRHWRWRAISPCWNHKHWFCRTQTKLSGRRKWKSKLLCLCVCKNVNLLLVDGNWGGLLLSITAAHVSFSASVSPPNGGWSHCDVDLLPTPLPGYSLHHHPYKFLRLHLNDLDYRETRHPFVLFRSALPLLTFSWSHHRELRFGNFVPPLIFLFPVPTSV